MEAWSLPVVKAPLAAHVPGQRARRQFGQGSVKISPPSEGSALIGHITLRRLRQTAGALVRGRLNVQHQIVRQWRGEDQRCALRWEHQAGLGRAEICRGFTG